MATELTGLQRRWALWRYAQPWGQTPLDYAAKITEEAGEVMGATLKFHEPGHKITHPQMTADKLHREMGQLFGTLLVLADSEDVDLLQLATDALADAETRFPARLVDLGEPETSEGQQ